jgi:hypothetical protein
MGLLFMDPSQKARVFMKTIIILENFSPAILVDFNNLHKYTCPNKPLYFSALPTITLPH